MLNRSSRHVTLAATSLLFATAYASASFAGDMQFRLVPVSNAAQCKANCPELISADGEITPSTPRSFVNFLKQHVDDKRVRAIVLFNSPGGAVQASINLGTILRKLGAATIVARAAPSSPGNPNGTGFARGRCFSACVYAFMGGIKRVIPPGSEAGVHRAYTPAVGPDLDGGYLGVGRGPRVSIEPDYSAQAIAQFSNRMGISLGLLQAAQQTPPTSIHIVTPAEASRWHLATQKF